MKNVKFTEVSLAATKQLVADILNHAMDVGVHTSKNVRIKRAYPRLIIEGVDGNYRINTVSHNVTRHKSGVWSVQCSGIHHETRAMIKELKPQIFEAS